MALAKEQIIGEPITAAEWNTRLSIDKGEEIEKVLAPFYRPLRLRQEGDDLIGQTIRAFDGIGVKMSAVKIYPLTQIGWDEVYEMNTDRGALYRLLDPRDDQKYILRQKLGEERLSTIHTSLSLSFNRGQYKLNESIGESIAIDPENISQYHRIESGWWVSSRYTNLLRANIWQVLFYEIAHIAAGDPDGVAKFARFSQLYGDGNYVMGLQDCGDSFQGWRNRGVVLVK